MPCPQGSAYFKSENVAWTFAYAAPELLLNANCSAKVGIPTVPYPASMIVAWSHTE